MRWHINKVWENDRMVIIDKPAGLLSIPDRFNKDIPNLYSILSSDYEAIYTVHRLDKQTSGLIIFAKDEECHALLSSAFENKKIEKNYLAIVDGMLSDESGTIDLPIAESNTKRGTYLTAKKGKPSITHYKTIEKYGIASLLDIRLETGRTHQIRVHLKAIGHPLVVDKIYGKRAELYLSEVLKKKYKRKSNQEERPLLQRQPLHAYSITIPAEIMGEEISVDIPLPKDMKAVVNQLSKLIKG